MKIKIIHFLPTINLTSGVAATIMNYYRKIDKSEIQFDFITFLKNNEKSYKNEIEKLGGKVYEVCPPTDIKKFNNSLKDILSKYKNQEVIFHNHQINFTILMYKTIKQNLNCKIIVHNHTSKYSDKIISSIRNHILCIPIRFLDVERFACSEKAGKLVFKRKKFYVMKNAIDFDKYKFDMNIRNKYRNELNLGNKYVIGHIGHFEKVKNHEFILDLFLRLYEKDKNIMLVLIGNGSRKDFFVNKVKNSIIKDNVIFLENRDDINLILNAFDVFVFPSKFEGLGIAAVEAQANGLMVIMSSKIPREVNISNSKILDINEKNINEWVEEIEKLKNKKKSIRKEKIDSQGFDINIAEKELIEEYKKIIKGD